MTTQKLSYEALDIAVKMLGYTHEERSAVITLKDGSRMTTIAHIFKTPEGIIFVNPDKCKISYRFENQEEFDAQKKFEFFDTDKEMWQDFTGMDDETWEEWNK